MSKKDHNWKVVKYIGDGAYYATCKCGYDYACGDCLGREDYTMWKLFPYCPMCGAKKTTFNQKVILLNQDVLVRYM